MQRAKKFCSIVVMTVASWSIANAQEPQPQPPPAQPTPDQPTPDQPTQDEPRQDLPRPDQAQQQTDSSEPTAVSAERVSAKAKIEKIDAKARQLTLKDKDGNRTTMSVPEDVDLAKLSKGDTVAVEYYSSVALALNKDDGKAGGTEHKAFAMRTAAPLPGGLIAHEMTVKAEVIKIDKDAGKLTIKGPAGAVDTLPLDTEMKDQLGELAKGDKIRAVYNQAVAINVTPEERKPKGDMKPKNEMSNPDDKSL